MATWKPSRHARSRSELTRDPQGSGSVTALARSTCGIDRVLPHDALDDLRGDARSRWSHHAQPSALSVNPPRRPCPDRSPGPYQSPARDRRCRCAEPMPSPRPPPPSPMPDRPRPPAPNASPISSPHMFPRALTSSVPSEVSRPQGAVGALGSPEAPVLRSPIMPNSVASRSAAARAMCGSGLSLGP
jgi:hypothetical protein